MMTEQRYPVLAEKQLAVLGHEGRHSEYAEAKGILDVPLVTIVHDRVVQSDDKLGTGKAGSLGDRCKLGFALGWYFIGKTGLEQAAGKHVSHIPEIGGDTCECEPAPIDRAPARLGIRDPVVGGPSRRILGAVLVLVLTAPGARGERVGTCSSYEFRAIDLACLLL